MTDPVPGDVFSTSAPQADHVEVVAPVVVGLAYELDANGKVYRYTAQLGDTPADVTASLAAALLEGQTALAVLVDAADLFTAGPIGQAYPISTPLPAGQMLVTRVQDAKVGYPAGLLRVLATREFWTRGPDGQPLRRVKMTVRREVVGDVLTVAPPNPQDPASWAMPGRPRIDTTDPIVEVDDDQIVTVISRQATGAVSIWESIAV